MSRWLSATVMATVVACSSAVPPALASGSHRLPAIPAGERIGLAVGRPTPDPGVASLPATSPSSHPGVKQQRFWVQDKHRYTSPWYAGSRRKMIAFGCTRAPLLRPRPALHEGRHGYHHGLDIAMPCGTPLYAAYRTRVVDPASAGSLGAAYGHWAFRLRSGQLHKDFVIGHVRHVFVEPGDLVTRGSSSRARRTPEPPTGATSTSRCGHPPGATRARSRPDRFLRLEREG